MHVSFGRTKYGAVDETLDVSFAELAEHLRLCAEMPRDPADKDHWHWISPMILHDGATHRRDIDIARMAAWFACDLDDGNYQLSDLKLRLLGTSWIGWTTTNSQPDRMRWRVIQKIDQEYDPIDHPRLVQWYQGKFPENRESIAKTSNPSRIFYCPALWSGATNLFHATEGSSVKVSAILAMVPPILETTPSMPSSTMVTERKAPLGNHVITRHMVEAAQMKGAGGRMYPMLCSAAKRYRINGWALTAQELAQAGREAAASWTPPHLGNDIEREAQRAIEWAERNVTPQSPLDRMRARIVWEQAKRLSRFNSSK